MIRRPLAASTPSPRPPPLSPSLDAAVAETLPEVWARHAATVDAWPAPPAGSGRADAVTLAGAVEAAISRALPYRPRLLALPEFEISWLDELPSLARAVRWAGLEARLQPPELVAVGPTLAEAAKTLRKLGLTIASRRLLLGQPNTKVAKGRGRSTGKYAMDIGASVVALRALGVTGTALSERDLEEAEGLVVRLAVLSDPRQRVPLAALAASASRAKALSLMMAVYGEVRTGVCYLARHEIDGDRVLPAVWGLRGPRVGKRRGRSSGGS